MRQETTKMPLHRYNSQSGRTASGSPLTLPRGARILAIIDGQEQEVLVDGFGDRGELFCTLATGKRRAVGFDRVVEVVQAVGLRRAA